MLHIAYVIQTSYYYYVLISDPTTGPEIQPKIHNSYSTLHTLPATIAFLWKHLIFFDQF